MTTIVVPVFNAPEETQRCLASLAQHIGSDVRVIVINDASDDLSLDGVLADMPSYWTRIDNERNVGFVASANLGMTMASPDDVLLLNADTEVTSGFLDALRDALRTQPTIASVSPLTNNGEIASIPEFCAANPYPEDLDRWADACRCSFEDDDVPSYVEVPTTIGFCMLLRREALDQVGYFDEVAFGRGYGEENDWCQRAIQAGWKHILCDRAFVAHRGGASFGPLGLKPGGEAMSQLIQRYPNYEHDVASFIQADPMAGRRQAIVEYYQNSQHNTGQ